MTRRQVGRTSVGLSLGRAPNKGLNRRANSGKSADAQAKAQARRLPGARAPAARPDSDCPCAVPRLYLFLVGLSRELAGCPAAAEAASGSSGLPSSSRPASAEERCVCLRNPSSSPKGSAWVTCPTSGVRTKGAETELPSVCVWGGRFPTLGPTSCRACSPHLSSLGPSGVNVMVRRRKIEK